jgi:tetratricopeptide (TPR) repeat protein
MKRRHLSQHVRKLPLKRHLQHRRLRDVNFFPRIQDKLLEYVPQDLLGINDDQLLGMHQLAWEFLESEAYADAVRSFTLLCQIQPFVPDFWYGLGKALRGCNRADDALSMLLVAETLDPSRFEFYKEAIECCLQVNQRKEAEHILHRMYAHRRSIDEFQERKGEFRDLKNMVIPHRV